MYATSIINLSLIYTQSQMHDIIISVLFRNSIGVSINKNILNDRENVSGHISSKKYKGNISTVGKIANDSILNDNARQDEGNENSKKAIDNTILNYLIEDDANDIESK